MDRRTVLATTGIALSAPLGGCLSTLTAGEDSTPDRPWTAGDPSEHPDGTHHLVVENHTDTTRPAWLRVVREDGAALVDGRYELPDGRGIEFEDIAAWRTTYTIDLAIDGEDVASLEWSTDECGPDSEATGDSGSRNATVRVTEPSDEDGEHRVSLVVDECDALYGPGLPTGPAEGFRLDE